MDIKKIQKIAALEYNCSCHTNCDGDCDNCLYNVTDDDEKEFFYIIWKMSSDAIERRSGWLFR